jgi:hypothetical protein
LNDALKDFPNCVGCSARKTPTTKLARRDIRAR